MAIASATLAATGNTSLNRVTVITRRTDALTAARCSEPPAAAVRCCSRRKQVEPGAVAEPHPGQVQDEAAAGVGLRPELTY
jgi:hypothetical protein